MHDGPGTAGRFSQEATMGSAPLQGALWGAAARDWAELAEPVQQPFFEAALDALEIGAGTRLLDAGCGSGLALVLASQRGAVVSGLDASPGLLEIARERLPEAELREGDLEALPFEDDSFDAVTAFNSVQYASDPTAALRELKRVAVAGSPVAVTTWGAPEQCEMRAVLGAIGSLLPPPPPGAAGPFALAAPGALEALIESAGLVPERAIDVPTPYVHADIDTAIRAHLASGPARRAIEHAGAEATREAIGQVCETARRDDGSVGFENVFKVVVARA
jgi:SAM-dependent methyltransferase